MQQYCKHIIFILSVLGLSQLQGQSTILDQSLLSEASFNTFTSVNATGAQSWYPSTMYGAVCSGYAASQNFENEDWLISPEMNLSQTNNVQLTFDHTRGSAAVLNVGVNEGWYKVFATADYTGDQASTVWIELEGVNQSISTAWQFVSSGGLVIPDAAKSETSRIAFRYMSSAFQSATWEIKNVKVTGEPESTNPNAGIFKITNWNIEWLGCTSFGPTNENLQINNAVSAMIAMNSDIYCLQEVSNTISNPSIATLVSLMGSDQWEGQIVPSITGDCDQRQGIIYKKDRVQFVNSSQLSSGSPAQGNSYYYNWASGRYPALYNLNFVAGTTVVPVSVINLHAKAEDGNGSSYMRRLGAAEALKVILDGTNYNTKNLMIIGDFNDYLIGTTSNTCGCSDSPYKIFMDDSNDYTGITQDLTNVTWNTPLIEHLIISNELVGNYVSSSATQEIAVTQNINNYYYTTSNHFPVSATFQFPVLNNQDFTYGHNSSWKVYPNPVKSNLTFDTSGLDNFETLSIYDMTGRKMFFDKINANTVGVSTLPAGIYILKVGGQYGRFVKE